MLEDGGFERDMLLTLKAEGVGTSDLKLMSARGFKT